MGVSRSTTLILAYLIKYKKWSLSKSYFLVLSRRKCVRPNCGFWRQLIKYEKRVLQVKNLNFSRFEPLTLAPKINFFQYNSVTMVSGPYGMAPDILLNGPSSMNKEPAISTSKPFLPLN
jgi:hypothetical protein